MCILNSLVTLVDGNGIVGFPATDVNYRWTVASTKALITVVEENYGLIGSSNTLKRTVMFHQCIIGKGYEYLLASSATSVIKKQSIHSIQCTQYCGINMLQSVE